MDAPGPAIRASIVLALVLTLLAPDPAIASPELSDARDSRPPAPAGAGLCVFETKGDYIHVSTSAWEASGHGWWINVNCNATAAIVTVQLQQHVNGGWTDAGSAGKATVRSGGGAGSRSTGRAACNTNAVTAWRSVIDVDVLNVLDSPSTLTTGSRNIRCRH
ncbi:hypothetical protein OIE67_38795 [Nonomuraea fuscirosea]|uniref:hypothetical protein n=1 Tax=Nonomuraea fuscirosea TaxID=1291556 RepID=UPI002DD896E0|nr:hypothetical protein [Nonomuraea fuscirosea]WSA49974.1 hypothetical protein OIE67_38795 [Nonomuraea fuscirosea]